MRERDLVRSVYGITVAALKSDIYRDIEHKKVKEIVSKNNSKDFDRWQDSERDNIDIKVLKQEYSEFLPQPIMRLGDLYVENYVFCQRLSIYLKYPQILPHINGENREREIFQYIFDQFKKDNDICLFSFREWILF